MKTRRALRRGADKSLAFPVSYFRICSTTKRILLGLAKGVGTTELKGEYVNTFFSIP
jgi:hypothetical protein